MCGLLVACLPADAQLDQLWKKTEAASPSNNLSGMSLSNDKIAGGLKEALTKSTGSAVAFTGRPDGYFKNQAIKILLPSSLQTVGKGMRMIGMGAQVDEFELSMTRAAEQAAPAAKQIFINAITKMSFADAKTILSGGNTAATNYFKKTSSTDLTQAFTPIVHQSMENVGVIKQFNELAQKFHGRSAGRQFQP
jgi:hypothetical protein